MRNKGTLRGFQLQSAKKTRQSPGAQAARRVKDPVDVGKTSLADRGIANGSWRKARRRQSQEPADCGQVRFPTQRRALCCRADNRRIANLAP